MREKYGGHVTWIRNLESGEAGMTSVLPDGAAGGGGPAGQRLKQLMEEVEAARAEREVRHVTYLQLL